MAVNTGNAIILIASWINLSFFSLEILLAIKFFQRPKRLLWHKIGVTAFVVADTVCTAGICWEAYLVLLVFPCLNLAGEFLDQLYWPISVVILATYTTASVEQAFLVALFHSLEILTLTKRRIITGFLVFGIFFHLAFSWASAALVLEQQNPGGRAFVATQIGAISCAATDCLIAITLSFTFYRLESRTIKGRTTQSMLRRLAVRSLTCGVIVASITLFSVVTLLKGNDVYPLFFFCQGRAYGLTILANFLLGLPTGYEESDPNASSRIASSRRVTDTGVVFRVEYGLRSTANTPHPESLNLEELSITGKAHPDSD
ncbi:hypothetical protein K438DRAFT_1955122 [Mycena galopus ATCC 62051]|nr:hypothetical protein K438DRAFT_1955122 [Mycena galopus ATCC 62051]